MDRAALTDELEREISALLRRIKRVLALRAELMHPELNGAGYLLFTYVAESGPLRASELTERFHLDKSAVSRQVQHLVDIGLVERTPDPADGRASLLVASRAGLDRLVAVNDQRRTALEERLGEFSDAELSEFVTLL